MLGGKIRAVICDVRSGKGAERSRLFDQSILASLGDPIIDQLAAYRARDNEAASYEPV